jgi:tRNA-Thr(GGU) m(6)t(6)A37 methyltransferase TsaA
MSTAVALVPVGLVRSPIRSPVDDVWGGVVATIELDADRFGAEALAGLDTFSHVEVVFLFDRVGDEDIVTTARHPRGRTDWPAVGVFAQRAKHRPNRLGVTVCRLVAVRGTSVDVESLDAIDGTPVLDLKPYMREFAPQGDVRQPAWATELMADYWRRGDRR